MFDKIKDAPYFVHNLFSFIDGAGIAKAVTVGLGLSIQYLFGNQTEIDAVYGAAILVVVDSFTGIAVAFKTQTPRTSQRLGRVLTKIFGYLAVIIVAAVTKRAMGPVATIPLVNAVLWLIIATEGLSILENVDQLGVGKFPVLGKILSSVLESKKPGDWQENQTMEPISCIKWLIVTGGDGSYDKRGIKEKDMDLHHATLQEIDPATPAQVEEHRIIYDLMSTVYRDSGMDLRLPHLEVRVQDGDNRK